MQLSENTWAASWQNQQSECAPSEDSDQPGHPPSLIRVFAVRMKKAWVSSYPLSAQRWLWSDWADAQADLSLLWEHTHFVGFVPSLLSHYQIDHCDETKKKYSWPVPHCKPELKETTSWTVGQAKDIASSPNLLVIALCRGRQNPLHLHILATRKKVRNHIALSSV